MKLGSHLVDSQPLAAVEHNEHWYLVRDLNHEWDAHLPITTDELLQTGSLDELHRWLRRDPPAETKPQHPTRVAWAPLVERPRNLWGVGLNFRQHAKDLDADTKRRIPTGFHRPATCLAAHGSSVAIPTTWGTITGEAEIGIVVGKRLTNASVDEARAAVAGYAPLLDLTAEELLRTDTRYIGRSKAFPQSVPLGPYLVTPDEWTPSPDTTIATLWDGKVVREGRLDGMTWDPWQLLSDFSHVFPWQPGDVLQTGTPGATPLTVGGRLAARISGLPQLDCRVTAAT